ncbi:hypothetical protein [Thioclava sp.]|uniref:hypothetical protein n=1 Tax=Thioclava sp. TaxID=1933450 RepID=UPI003AA7D30D
MILVPSKLASGARVLLLRSGIGIGLAAAATSLVLAQDAPPKGGRGGPPKEAFMACENLAAKASCDIATPEGKAIKGICMATPDKKLACMPKDAPPPPKN